MFINEFKRNIKNEKIVINRKTNGIPIRSVFRLPTNEVNIEDT